MAPQSSRVQRPPLNIPILPLHHVRVPSASVSSNKSLPPSVAFAFSMSGFESGRIEVVSGKGARAGSPNLPASAKPRGSGDSEAKRRKRIAKYKVYTVERKVKDSLRKGLRWIQNKCSRIVHGY